jgi:rubredoxin
MNIPRAIFMCRECGYLFDESIGDPEAGVPAHTDMDALPDGWHCPECGKDKSYLEQII